MLRKLADKDGKDWDKLLSYLLFAYREVPQSSTGVFPFELLYGRHVRGPLDVLKQSWESSSCDDESNVSYVMATQKQLEKMTKLVKENMQDAQRKQNTRYNWHVGLHTFAPVTKYCCYYLRQPASFWLNGKDVSHSRTSK